MYRQHIMPGLVLAAAMMAGGCGGGSDGVGVTTTPVGATPPLAPTATGLVPAAAPLGSELYQTVSHLRVLRSDTVWTYLGTDVRTEGGIATSENYTNTVTIAGPTYALSEQSSNAFNGGQHVAERLPFNGLVHQYKDFLSLAKGSPAIGTEIVELRAPLVQNAQYINVDRKNVSLGVDLDGDKVDEAADMAVYTRVIGKEVLDLPSRMGVEALRVDITLRARTIWSRTGLTAPVHEVVRSNWYAPDLGIVKSRLVEPIGSGATAGQRVATEILQSWDGVTTGLGNMATLPARAPASSPTVGSVLQYPIDAVGANNWAVVVGSVPDRSPSAGLVLTQLDMRGLVMAARNYTINELFPGAEYITEIRLALAAGEMRLFAKVGSSQVWMANLSTDGQRILRPPVRLVSDPAFASGTQQSSYYAGINGTGMWVAWRRLVPQADGRHRSAIALSKFTWDGLREPRMPDLLAAADATISDFNVAVGETQVAASWREDGPQPVRRMAFYDADTATPREQIILDTADNACDRVELHKLFYLAATCTSNTPGPIGAARLGHSGALELSTGTTLASETLQAPWLSVASGRTLFTGSEEELVGVVNQFATLLPDEAPSHFVTVFRTNSARGPLAARQPTLLARIPEPGMTVRSIVPFYDRLLLIGSDRSGYLNTMMVWIKR